MPKASRPPGATAHADRDAVGPIPVRKFGKYYLVRKLAEGGMAEIFLAKQVGVEGFEKNVVLKRMLAHLSGVSDFVAMFLDEARLASRLSHPNVVQIHDLGFEEGCYYIAMEHLAGEDFSAVIRSHARARQYVPIQMVLRVLAEAAHGLHYAHEFTDSKGVPLNIVHRDVSPSNIFVTYTGQVKLLDFGIAKAESRLTQTTAGVVKGKYQYMSPEQASAGEVDRRSDVYSLGVCLYEALTNYRPFARDTDLAILNSVLKNEYRRPVEARPDLPLELDAVIRQALALAPEARYQTAGDFALELEGYLRSMTSSSSGAALSQFMTSYFGPERVASRTRIAPLADLQPPSEAAPPLATPAGPAATSDELSERRTKSLVPEPRARWPRTLLLGGLAALLLVGLSVVATRAFLGQTSQADAGAASAPPEVVAPVALRELDAAVASLDEPDAAGAGGTDAGRAVAVAVVEPDAGRVAVARPVLLTTPIIAAVVRRSAGQVAKCFELHRSDLQGTSGQIAVTFTIAGSGRVTRTESALADRAVGRCLEERVKQLRFPAHVDKEVTVTLPFAYQLAQ